MMTSHQSSHVADNHCNMAGTCREKINQTDLAGSSVLDLSEILINWRLTPLWILVTAGITGNALVCASIVVERKLQNVTNYFLVSLAVADLLVSMFVMPCCIVQEMMGYWPFGLIMCDVWLLCDVVMCTSSIMHMCTISMDRYTAIRDPLRSRAGNKSAITVSLKVAVVWLISIVIGSPLIGLGALSPTQILSEDRQCAIFNSYYVIYGSLAAFFGPLTVMMAAFSLTIRLLNQQSRQLHADGGGSGGGMRRCKATKSTADGSFRVQMPSKSAGNTRTAPVSTSGSYRLRPDCKFIANNSPTHDSNNSIENRSDSRSIHITKNLIAIQNGNCKNYRSDASEDNRLTVNRNVTSLSDTVKPTDGIALCGSDATKGDKMAGDCPTRCCKTETAFRNNDATTLGLINTTEPKMVDSNELSEADSNKSPKITDIFNKHTNNSHKMDLFNVQLKHNMPSTVYAPACVTMPTSRSVNDVKCLAFISNETCDRTGTTRPNCIGFVSKSTSFPITVHLPPSELDDEQCPLLASEEAYDDVIKPFALSLRPDRALDQLTVDNYCDVTEHRTISNEVNCTGTDAVRRSPRKRWSCHDVTNGSPASCDVTKHRRSKTSHALSGGDPSRTFQSISHEYNLPQSTRPAELCQLVGNDVIETLITSPGPVSADCDVVTHVNHSNTMSPVKFKSLVHKHAAAFKVAGMLVATREDRQTKAFNSVKTERKAVKVLGIMFGIFCTCWTPFFTANLAMGICQTCDIDPILFKVFLWFGYISSTLNPIVYTIFNRDFKNTFVRLLRCHCSAANTGADGRVSQLQMLVRQNPHLVNGGAMLAIRALRPRGVTTSQPSTQLI